jgi:DNA-binding PadR family transcriptional regulator
MSSQGGSDATLQSLIGELNGSSQSDSSSDPAVRTETVVQDASTDLFDDGTPSIDDGLVKESLPELLMLLVGLREGDTHGKGVMEDLNRFFGAQLSPGTVYPLLHDLEEEGFLEMRELVQTKEYAIDDADAVRDELREAMTQHLALGMVFHRALDEFDTDE